MSFGGSTADYKAAPPRKPAGVDEQRFSTNEQAKPVPYFAGYRRQAVTFITEIFKQVKAGVNAGQNGGGKAPGGRSGTKYYGSFACLIGYGRLTHIGAIYLNDVIAWQPEDILVGALEFGSAEYLDLTLPRHAGIVRVYRGSETQVADDYLNTWDIDSVTGLPHAHPAYRGFAYAVFKGLYFGFNQTDVQNVEMAVLRASDVTWTDYNAGAPQLLGANPVAVVAELLQHPRLGLGLPDEMLDTVALDLLSVTTLESETSILFPYFDRATEARSALNEVLQYCAAFPLINAAGTFNIGVYRPPASLAALPEVNESDFITPPVRQAADWRLAKSETVMRHLNVYKNYKESAATWRDRGLFAITGETNSNGVERNFLITPEQAAPVAAALGRAAALPESTGTVALRKTGTLFQDLVPGAMFKLNYTSRGITGQVCRVTERTEDAAGKPSFSIKYTLDFSYLLASSVRPPSAVGPGGELLPGDAASTSPTAISLARVIELPLGLCPVGRISVGVLAARPDTATQGFIVHLKESYDWDGVPAASYNRLAAVAAFARRGTLLEDYPATVPLLDEDVGLVVQLAGVDTEIGEQSAFDAVSDELLVFVNDEIFSVARAELVAAGLYRLYGLRTRFGTTRAAHATDDVAWVIARADLAALQHPQFDLGNTFTLKLAPQAGLAVFDLSGADELAGSIAGRIHIEPALANLSVNGSLASASYTTGADLLVEWTLTDAHADVWQATKLSLTRILQLSPAPSGEEWGDGGPVVEVVATGDEEHTLLNAALITALVSEVSFRLRLVQRTVTDFAILDTTPAELFVTKL